MSHLRTQQHHAGATMQQTAPLNKLHHLPLSSSTLTSSRLIAVHDAENQRPNTHARATLLQKPQSSDINKENATVTTTIGRTQPTRLLNSSSTTISATLMQQKPRRVLQEIPSNSHSTVVSSLSVRRPLTTLATTTTTQSHASSTSSNIASALPSLQVASAVAAAASTIPSIASLNAARTTTSSASLSSSSFARTTLTSSTSLPSLYKSAAAITSSTTAVAAQQPQHSLIPLHHQPHHAYSTSSTTLPSISSLHSHTHNTHNNHPSSSSSVLPTLTSSSSFVSAFPSSNSTLSQPHTLLPSQPLLSSSSTSSLQVSLPPPAIIVRADDSNDFHEHHVPTQPRSQLVESDDMNLSSSTYMPNFSRESSTADAIMAMDTPTEDEDVVDVDDEQELAASLDDTITDEMNVSSCSTAMDLSSSPVPNSEIITSTTSVPQTNDSHLWASGELAKEIVDYWFESEMKYSAHKHTTPAVTSSPSLMPQHSSTPSPTNYLQHQPDLNSKMREILCDWLHEVCIRFRFQSETIFLAVALLDRFLSCKIVSRKKLQLVGCTSLLVAAKYEEIYIPEINDFLIISDHAYEREHLLAMEGILLNTLNFSITQVTSLRFYQRFMNLNGVDMIREYEMMQQQAQQQQVQQQQQLPPSSQHRLHSSSELYLFGQFLLELTLQYIKFIEYRPSTIAASIMYLMANQRYVEQNIGNIQQNNFMWTHELQQETRHTLGDIQACTSDVYSYWSSLHETANGSTAAAAGGNKCLAVWRKYGKERTMYVNTIQLVRPHCISVLNK